jgi:nucleotide-binding universal stress UspA family protein
MIDGAQRKVMVGVSGDEDVEAVLGFAADEARRRGAGVHLVHVVDPGPGDAAVAIEDGAARMLGRAALSLAALSLSEVLDEGHPVSTELPGGVVSEVLVDSAEAASVLVLQHHRVGRSGTVPTMSTTDPVAARSQAPVVTVPDWWAESPTRQDIVVGVEDADRSRVVVRAALEEARRRGCRVRLLHAWDSPCAGDASAPEDEVARAYGVSLARDLWAGLGWLLADFPDVEATVVVEHASPAQALVRGSHRSALVVVGRRRDTVPAARHLGPVAGRVVRRSTCPVMVVDAVPVVSLMTSKAV